jgi:hypothetical protein
MSQQPFQFADRESQANALGTYRHDVAYTAALKSEQALALGSYRHDVAYTAALKSVQAHALGNYRHDVAYTAALKSAQAMSHQGGTSFKGQLTEDSTITGVEQCLAPVIFLAAPAEKGEVA